MIKSCISNYHIYHIKIFCLTPKSRWYGDEHGSNNQKSQNTFKNKNKLKKLTVKNHTNIKNTFQKINHEYLHERKHVLRDWWFQSTISWYNQTKSMTNVESYSQEIFWWCKILWTWVYVSYKKHHQNHENLHVKTTGNLYIKKSHIFVRFASTSKIVAWFVIPKELKARKT